jgi:hypothetical protein
VLQTIESSLDPFTLAIDLSLKSTPRMLIGLYAGWYGGYRAGAECAGTYDCRLAASEHIDAVSLRPVQMISG